MEHWIENTLVFRPHRLARSRTSAFHAGNTGSNPVGDAKRFQRVTVSEPHDTPGGQPGWTTLKPLRVPPQGLLLYPL